MTIAEHILQGAWTARCLSWVVSLQRTGDTWAAKLWHWPLDKERTEVGTQDGFDSAKKAVKWAADLLSDEGVSVLLNDGTKVITLIDTLQFTPAPQAASFVVT